MSGSFKNISVEGDRTTNLGDAIDEAINGFIKTAGTLDSFQVTADLNAGGYGKAVVSVFYTPKKSK